MIDRTDNNNWRFLWSLQWYLRQYYTCWTSVIRNELRATRCVYTRAGND